MPPTLIPRQQRRKLRRDLTERGRKALARGLPQTPSNEDALGIALAFLDTLDAPAEDAPASRLADMAEALLDRTMNQQTKGLAYACRKGCSWCCWQRVIATAPEIFRVAAWMRANAAKPGVPTLGAIAASEANALQAGPIAPGAQRQPCALLIDNACGIHPGRPLACRAVLSMSAEACRKAMEDPSTAEPVPLVMAGMDSAEVVRTLMLTAVAARGLSDAGYDLTQALAVVLPDPTAEARWLAGEDILAGVRSGPRSPQARTAQARMIEMLASLREG